MNVAPRINARASGVLATGMVVIVSLVVSAGASNDAGAQSDRSAHAASQPVRNGLIAFDRVDGIFVMKPNGKDRRRLTKPPKRASDQVPRWSPDGQRVLFLRYVKQGTPDEFGYLYVINKDGTGLTNLTPTASFHTFGPGEGDWSPDGRQIVMERVLGPISKSGVPAVVGLFIMRADGPDTNASAIYVVDVDGSNLHLVRKMPANRSGSGSPRWSPDGKTILFGTKCIFDDCHVPPTGAQLFTMRPDGSHVRQITRLPGNSFNGAWSPDGKKIAFARQARNAPLADVWTMNANGTGLRRLTNAPRLVSHHPDWQRRP